MTQEEILQILLIAKEWNGKIETYFNKEGRGKKATYTYYWRLYFGEEPPFFMQLTHDTKSQKVGWDRLCSDAVSYWLFKDEPALGYYNKGMLKKAIEIGIPVIDLGEK